MQSISFLNITSADAGTYCPSGYGYNSGTNKCEADPLCPNGWYDNTTYSSPTCLANATYTCFSSEYTYNPDTFRCEAEPDCCAGVLVNAASSVYCDEGHPPPCSCEGYVGTHCIGDPDCYGGTLYYLTLNPASAICVRGPTVSCPSGYTYWSSQRICYASPQCPNGGSFNSSLDKCQATPITDEKDDPCGLNVGKPVNVASGTVYTSITDFSLKGTMSVNFTRYYKSTGTLLRGFGFQWSNSFDTRVMSFGSNLYKVINPDGSVFYYNDTDGDLVYEADIPKGLTSMLIKNQDSTFKREYKDGSKEEFNTAGYLTAIVDRNGNRITFTRDASYRLTKIIDPSGREINITTTSGKITSITLPDGRTYSYSYLSGTGFLGSVTYPDGTQRNYEYAAYISGVGYMLTGIKNENGSYIEKHTYDAQGKAITSSSDGTNNNLTISYISDTQSTVTDSLGRVTTYNIGRSGGQNYPTSILGPDCSGCGQGNVSYTYDSNLNITSKTDPNGNITTFTHDADGNMLTETEAYGTADQRTTTYTYNSFGQVLTETDNDGNITIYTYDANGNMLTKTEAYGTVDERTTTYTYNVYGQMLTTTDPDGNTTTNTYDQYGNLETVTNALNQTTTYTYDIMSNLLLTTDTNGNVTTYQYDLRDRLIRETKPDGGIINYEYDLAGNRTAITDANGNRTTFTYDSLNRLIELRTPNSELTTYTYDSENNMTSMTIKDSNNNAMTSETYTYDIYNRLTRTTHADNTYTEQSYDALGNILTKRDENGNTTTFTYDSLNRLTQLQTPDSELTIYTYDRRNNLISVTDANNNTTTYNYDTLSRLISTISPDTGTTTYTYDPNGNMLTKTDANSITTTYVYDALNRQITIQFPDSTQNINYYYDDTQLQNGVGRLTAMTDQSGITWYDYDKMGRVVMETRQVNNLFYRTEYAYDLNGNLSSITYPGGRKIAYTYNQLNKVTSVTETLNGVTSTLASNIVYQPFGEMNSLTYGNGLQQSIGYNNRYQITSINVGSIQSLTYTYANNGNITGITNNLNPANTKSYTYDSLNRLTIATGQWGAITYAYDSVGNRTYETTNTGNTTYNYTLNTNKLTLTTGEKNLTFSYDNNGNTISENTRQYIYNQNQRLVKAMDSSNVLGEYIYNGKGQRADKLISSQNKCTVFHYDQNGLLITESTRTGNIKAEYIYLNGQPLAKIENNNIYYYHNDHLGTPSLMTDSSGSVSWQGEFLPFGEPLSITGSITNNLRFPGQYYDSETGLHQNWWRDYKKEIGRYPEADPIGLEGGINLFTYVANNPCTWKDPLGLKTWRCQKPLDFLSERGWESGGKKSGPDIFINPFYHEYYCIGNPDSPSCYGQSCSNCDEDETIYGTGWPSNDSYDSGRCGEIEDDNECFEKCLLREGISPRPSYGLIGPGTSCQEWTDNAITTCRRQCRGR